MKVLFIGSTSSISSAPLLRSFCGSGQIRPSRKAGGRSRKVSGVWFRVVVCRARRQDWCQVCPIRTNIEPCFMDLNDGDGFAGGRMTGVAERRQGAGWIAGTGDDGTAMEWVRVPL